ncbi:helix-turn-helix domain-containing protein (plasmid) [Sinorhizobium meliloti]|nr:helix-turn-helix domain-containing protein [Sinorhizobium meliloti]WQP10575.1 helix-turn-helix domain-containing protein [Sinorhizobium meliloti]WQP24035.1 helix-turn-helix domain-containing protein [Sinorhizobium meliloti]
MSFRRSIQANPPRGVSSPSEDGAGALAKKLNLPRTRIERIAAEQTPITTDTALRLAKYFRTTPEFG